VPVPSLSARPPVFVRFVIALCAFSLLATALVGVAQPTVATDLGSRISTSRQSQNYFESQMRSQDRALASIQRQMKQSRRGIRQAKQSVKRSRRALALSKRILVKRRARLKSFVSGAANPDSKIEPWRYERRLKGLRTDLRVAERRKASIGRRLRSLTRAHKARKYRLGSLKRQRRTAIYRRESAEGGLASRIVQMTQLAGGRVANQSAVSLSAGGGSFSWPSTGRISQTYGCTGFYLNPRRGSCRHFHDGLDIVDGYGTPVRAAAVGVVAYAGWNPWDERGRAWIVVIVHPDGFVTRYGHMTPTDRVRAGELVYTGQVIGKMGNTGRSTGTHLHFELLRGRTTVSPLAYLPAGVVKIKVDKKSTKKGLARANRKAKARKRAAAKRQARKARKRASQSQTGLGVASEACDAPEQETPNVLGQPYVYPFVADAEGPPSGDTAACSTDAALEAERPARALAPPAGIPRPVLTRSTKTPLSDDDPGVRRHFRGTSPIPF
jgi:murein DD-endopeptidase MepM/ murein hydrolase activator NlpD